VPLVAYQRGDEWNSPAVRWLARGVRRFIANSTTTLKSLTSLGIPSGRVSVIYPPLDLETLRTGRSSSITRANFGVDASSPCFGIVGMLLPWKGHAVFLNAAKRVFERIPKARAFVIGAAPHRAKEYEGEVRALAQDLGIADRVIFTGFRPNVPDMLELLDVVVHASIAPEPFGRVIAEAMAMRRPVIATAAGGPTEIIEDGRTGLLSPLGDADALADRIIRLIEDPSLAEQIASAGYSEVRERFSGETHARLVRQVYDRVLRPKSKRSVHGSRRNHDPAPDTIRKETK
jgi:glycosyltransferase involved in cell wall biosynthesis